MENLTENCGFGSDQHFSFKYFQNNTQRNTFVIKSKYYNTTTKLYLGRVSMTFRGTQVLRMLNPFIPGDLLD